MLPRNRTFSVCTKQAITKKSSGQLKASRFLIEQKYVPLLPSADFGVSASRFIDKGERNEKSSPVTNYYRDL
jgi:hypothetical protein